VTENLLCFEYKEIYMNATSGFKGSEAVVLPDPIIVLQGFVNFILFPLYVMAGMTRLHMPAQLPMPQQSAALPPAAKSPVMQTNEERWVWRDCHGREREITVYRKVKGSE